MGLLIFVIYQELRMQHTTNWLLSTGTAICERRPWILWDWPRGVAGLPVDAAMKPVPAGMWHSESDWPRGVTMSPAGLPVDAAMKPVPAGMPIGHGVPEH